MRKKELEKHTQKYCYLSMESLINTPFNADYFRKEIEEMSSIKANIKSSNKKKLKQNTAYFQSLNLIKDKMIIDLIKFLQELIFLRTYRINALYKSNYLINSLFCTIQNKLGLKNKDIFFLTIDEIQTILRLGFITKKKVEKIYLRKKVWAVLLFKGKLNIFSGYDEVIKAIEYYNIKPARLNSLNKTVIEGKVASQGQITGRVKIIKSASHLDKLEKGDVLVTTMTTPDFVVGMSRASAIITDEGGITCHAAIVSRELGVPCIVGTNNATNILNDNDLVFVDAILGKITILEKFIDKQSNILSGKSIFPGIVKGKINERDIFVCHSVTPNLLSIIYQIKGLIVEENSYTSHAYLYSQEFRIPAIMGVENAATLLKQNQRTHL